MPGRFFYFLWGGRVAGGFGAATGDGFDDLEAPAFQVVGDEAVIGEEDALGTGDLEEVEEFAGLAPAGVGGGFARGLGNFAGGGGLLEGDVQIGHFQQAGLGDGFRFVHTVFFGEVLRQKGEDFGGGFRLADVDFAIFADGGFIAPLFQNGFGAKVFGFEREGGLGDFGFDLFEGLGEQVGLVSPVVFGGFGVGPGGLDGDRLGLDDRGGHPGEALRGGEFGFVSQVGFRQGDHVGVGSGPGDFVVGGGGDADD